MSHKPIEHFVTLFDRNFLPMGLALYNSLINHGKPFHLWVLCMDDLVGKQLNRISLPYVTLIPLQSVETRELLQVKPGRSRAEYCWTLTPFTFQAIFDRDASVERVTYVDADLFFFASPQILLRELDASGKHVLITEHAYAPEYIDFFVPSGRFCVQFLTFRRSTEAATVMHWWQDKCLEWCFAQDEEGRYGDQKYLDVWPELFAREVHVVRQTEKTLAPWNVRHFAQTSRGRLEPVFYHFHEFRIIAPRKVRLYGSYEIGEEGLRLYETYFAEIRKILLFLKKLGWPIPCIKEKESLASSLLQFIKRNSRYKRV
jgi:hypothetical protein